MTQGYLYDAFLSYSRSGSVRDWVANHFLPILSNALSEELPYSPRLFADLSAEAGISWPVQLAEALKGSRCLVPIWSTSYFRSSWCVSEFSSMVEREKVLGLSLDRPLIFPVIFHNGMHFPQAVQNRQALDLRQWAYPFEQFRASPRYIDFYDQVRQLAGVLAKGI